MLLPPPPLPFSPSARTTTRRPASGSSVWFGTGAAGLIAGRFAAGLLVRGWRSFTAASNRRAAIYGGKRHRPGRAPPPRGGCERRHPHLRRLRRPAGWAGAFAVNGYPRLGTLEALIATGRTTRHRPHHRRRFRQPPRSASRGGDGRALGAAGRYSSAGGRDPLEDVAARSTRHVGPVAMIDLCDKPIADWGFDLQVGFRQGAGHPGRCLSCRRSMLAVAAAIKLDSRGPDLLPPDPLRLQQRADRGHQVPLDAYERRPTPRPRSSSPRTTRA